MLVWAACTGTGWTVGSVLWGFAGSDIDREDEGQALRACCNLLYCALETSGASKLNDEQF